MQKNKFIFITISTLLIFVSCAPSVSFVGDTLKRKPKPKDFEILYIDQGNRLAENTITLGTISVYDAGLAINCGYWEVIEKAEQEAKRIGADAIKVTEIKPPDNFSTCYRIETLAIGYNGPDTGKITYEKILAPLDILDSAYIAFTDCSPCKEYGIIDNISKTKNKLLLIPIGVFTQNIDAEEHRNEYPITGSRMNEHLQLLLKSYDWNVKFIDDDASYYDSLSIYYYELLDNLFYNNGNPLEWNISSPLNIEDPSTLIYIPIAIERKAQFSKTGRFYMLIVDNKGEIMNYSCLTYQPKLWSRNFNTFANDIEGKLILTK